MKLIIEHNTHEICDLHVSLHALIDYELIIKGKIQPLINTYLFTDKRFRTFSWIMQRNTGS